MINFKKIVFGLIFLLAITQIKAQDNTFYLMQRVPQTMQLNPAFQPYCRTYVEIPAISSLKIGLNNTGFAYDDFIHKGTGNKKDSLILDLNKISSEMKDQNYLNFETSFNILAFGFKVDEMYFSFGIANKTSARIGYPDDIAKIKDGNLDGIGIENKPKELDLSGIKFDFMNYNEVSFGVSRKINDKLVVGGKFKYLMGTVSMFTEKSKIIWKTAPVEEAYAYTFDTDIQIKTSAPVDIVYQKEDTTKLENVEFNDNDPLDNLIFNKNRGVAFDFGATYEINDQIAVSASIIDLGYIDWKTNTNVFSSEGGFVYNGIDLSDSLNLDQFGTIITDSLENSFKHKERTENFTTWLTPKIFLAASYKLNEKLNFGLMSRTLIYDGSLHSSLTISANTNVHRNIMLCASYSLMNNSYTNLGVGFSAKLGPMQFYFATDNLLGYITPHTRNASLRFGIGLMFGCKQKIDLPSIEAPETF